MTFAEEAVRPRLLVLASTYPRWSGDPEPAFVHELAKRLVDRFDVAVLCPHAAGAARTEVLDGVHVRRYRYAWDALETLVNDGGIVTNLRRAPWKWLLVPGFLLAQSWAYWRQLRAWRPEVVHAHWLLPQGLLAATVGRLSRRAPPFVVTSHGADLFALRAAPLAALKRMVLLRAAAITVVSSAMRDEVARIGASTAGVTVQPMGVDLQQRFTPDPAVERSRDEILFVGRLVEKKGLRHLIDAMPAIVRARPTAFLTVAGFGPELPARQAQAAALGLGDRIRFVGAVAQRELPALYRRAAVLAAPFVQARSGDQEGLGLVQVEALGCGCPVVVSDLPAVRQVFPECGDAILVPPGDVTALANGVLAAMQASPPAAEDDRRRQRRLEVFDWRSVANRYGDLLLSALREHARARSDRRADPGAD